MATESIPNSHHLSQISMGNRHWINEWAINWPWPLVKIQVSFIQQAVTECLVDPGDVVSETDYPYLKSLPLIGKTQLNTHLQFRLANSRKDVRGGAPNSVRSFSLKLLEWVGVKQKRREGERERKKRILKVHCLFSGMPIFNAAGGTGTRGWMGFSS